MSRNRRRAVAIAAVGAFAVAPMVSACAAGQHPQTVLPTQLAEGANASVDKIAIRNVFVLGPDPGQRLPKDGSAPLYASIVAARPDRLVAVEAPDAAGSVEIAGGALTLPPNELVSTNTAVSGPPASNRPTPGATPSRKPGKPGKTPRKQAPTPGAPGSATPTPGAPAGSPTAGTQQPGAPGAAPALPQPSSVVLTRLTKELTGSETIKVTLHFQQAGAVTLNVPVVTRQGYYATYSPAPAAPGPATTPGVPSASASAGASAGPTAGASSSASAGAAAKPAKARKAKATPSA